MLERIYELTFTCTFRRPNHPVKPNEISPSQQLNETPLLEKE